VVPREALPEEPALAELPVDPVAAGDIASPLMDRIEPDELTERSMNDARGFARTKSGPAPLLEEDDQQDWRDAGAHPKRSSP
jgi:hypothetical protein